MSETVTVEGIHLNHLQVRPSATEGAVVVRVVDAFGEGVQASVGIADLLDALGYEDTTEEIERLRAASEEESLGEDGLADWERELLATAEPERKWKDGDLVRLAESSTESFFPTRYAGTVGRVIGYEPERPLPYHVEYGPGNDAQFSEDELEPVGRPRAGDRFVVTTDKVWLAAFAGRQYEVTKPSGPYVYTVDDDGDEMAFLHEEIEVVQ